MGNWLDDVKPEFRPHAQLGADIMEHCRMAAALAIDGNAEVYDVVVDLLTGAGGLVMVLSDKEIEPRHQHYVVEAQKKTERALVRLKAINESISELGHA